MKVSTSRSTFFSDVLQNGAITLGLPNKRQSIAMEMRVPYLRAMVPPHYDKSDHYDIIEYLFLAIVKTSGCFFSFLYCNIVDSIVLGRDAIATLCTPRQNS